MWKLAIAVGLGLAGAAAAETEKAIVAGGCFWCVESDFEGVDGVKRVVSGYTGGASENPTYDDHEGHYEAVEITFDNAVISYAELMAKFLRSVDVLDAGGRLTGRLEVADIGTGPARTDRGRAEMGLTRGTGSGSGWLA